MTVKCSLPRVSVLAVLALVLGACGPSASNGATIIATSVAMTVDAENTRQAQLTPTAAPVTPSLAPLTPPTTPFATKAPPTAPGTGSAQCTASATFISETIPDGAIMSPGAVFTKSWRIQNTGTCGWDSKWKLVYMSGDLMGGANVYNFPQPAAPGQIVDVPVIFTAPTLSGSYRGYWKIQSPWGKVFGDSGSGNAFWVDIVVGSGTPANNRTQTVFDITNVTYTITKRCAPANTFWHVLVNLSSNGPVKVTFDMLQSDGNGQHNIHMTFTSATTQTFDYGEWSQGWMSSPNPRWVQAITTSPSYHEWPHSELLYLC